MLTHPLIASEAIHAVDIPTIKAWDRDDDGNIRAFQRVTCSPDAECGIRVSYDGIPKSMPLFVTAKYVVETFRRIAFTENLYPERSPMIKYRDIVVNALETGKIDKRLCPESRSALHEGISERAAGLTPRYTEDLLVNMVSDAEYSSLCKRILVKAMGYSRGPTAIAKMLNAVLWQDLYQHDIACAAVLLKGRSADTNDYRAVSQIWQPCEYVPHGLQSVLQTHRPAAIHSMEGHPRITQELIDRTNAFPATLREAGLKPAVWRMLLKMSVPQNVAIKPLISNALGENGHLTAFFGEEDANDYRSQFNTAKRNSVDLLNRLAELGAHDCPATVLRTISRLTTDHLAAVSRIILPIVQRARWARRRGLVKDTARLVPLIADVWSSFIEDDLPIASGKGATWDAIMRGQEEWHREQVLKMPVEEVEWSPLLPEFSTKTAAARELTSTLELVEEGRIMNHCVGGYSSNCVTGRSRIFSITLANGKARSTLQASIQPSGTWKVNQHYGYNNQSVHKSLKAWETTLLRAINRAQKKSAPEMRMAA